jgi:hypothetical protein
VGYSSKTPRSVRLILDVICLHLGILDDVLDLIDVSLKRQYGTYDLVTATYRAIGLKLGDFFGGKRSGKSLEPCLSVLKFRCIRDLSFDGAKSSDSIVLELDNVFAWDGVRLLNQGSREHRRGKSEQQ